MLHAHTVEQVRTAEQATGDLLTSGALMQRAATGLATVCARRLGRVYGSRVVALVGSGDNGGDALFAGARLAARGARVTAVAAGSKLHHSGTQALVRHGGRTVSLDDLSDDALDGLLDGAELVLDGLVGIGARGALRSGAARCARAVADAGAADRTVAVDVPSGVDAATGAVTEPAIRAVTTVTFGTYKPGLLVLPGAEYAGRVELVPIGLDLPAPDLVALQAQDVARLLPEPGQQETKYTRGVVGIVAGSETYTGAAVMCCGGALRGGAGYLRYVSTAHPAEQVRQRFPEVVVTVLDSDAEPKQQAEDVLGAGRVQAWVAGPGLGTGDEGDAVLEALLGTDLPVLVDADGLTVLSRRPELLRRNAPTLLTPHEGEFARLIGKESGEAADELAADRLGTLRAAAADLGATILLKGSTTLVVQPDGTSRVNRTGSGWLASAGTGDVLSGVCGALLAAGLNPLDAGSVGAYLHGLAAGLAAPPITAVDVMDALPAAWAQVHRESLHWAGQSGWAGPSDWAGQSGWAGPSDWAGQSG